MNEFIHTIGIETYLTDEQYNAFSRAYGNNNKIYYWDSVNKKRVFLKYADRGFRMEITTANENVTKYDPLHRRYRADWSVTPAKLLYQRKAMMKLFTPQEYEKACHELYKIIDEIENATDVDLLKEGRLYRVDIAKDIPTPSEEYTQEVIRLAKKALFQHGYIFSQPIPEEKRIEERKDENGVFFHNKSQDVKAKLYNKLEDLKIHNYITTGMTGLLRFELALKRRFLLNKKYIREIYLGDEELAYILGRILNDAYDLMHSHITSPLWSGAMLSKNLQKLYILRYCDYKKESAKYRKIMDYRKECSKADCMKYVENAAAAMKYFKEMGLSPLYCKDEIRYIPSFADLLDGTENEEIKAFVER